MKTNLSRTIAIHFPMSKEEPRDDSNAEEFVDVSFNTKGLSFLIEIDFSLLTL